MDSLHLAGVGDGRLAVGLGISGAVAGLLYAVGHPAYDSTTSKLFMPDLEYDIGTRNLLTGSLAWLGGEAVERFLRANVRVDLGPTLEDGRELLQKSLNRELAEGVRLWTEIHAGQIHDIRAAPEALLAPQCSEADTRWRDSGRWSLGVAQPRDAGDGHKQSSEDTESDGEPDDYLKFVEHRTSPTHQSRLRGNSGERFRQSQPAERR